MIVKTHGIIAASALPVNCEDLYFSGMASFDETGKQLKELTKKQHKQGERIAALEARGTESKTEPWLKRHAHWVPVASFLLGGGLIGSIAGLFVDSRVEMKLKEPISVLSDQAKTLARIDAKLNEVGDLLKIVTADRLKRIAEMPDAEFGSALPELGTVLLAAKSEGFSAPGPIVKTISSRLSGIDSSAPAYWGTAVALINYRSLSPSVALPDCLNAPPVVRLAEPVEAFQTTIKVTPAIYENCRIDLDSPTSAAVRKFFLNFSGLELRRCHVVYRGGPLLFPEGAAGSVVFANCTFEFSVPGPPPVRAQQLLNGLLASEDLQSATTAISGA
jgi:hypothetical protein